MDQKSLKKSDMGPHSWWSHPCRLAQSAHALEQDKHSLPPLWKVEYSHLCACRQSFHSNRPQPMKQKNFEQASMSENPFLNTMPITSIITAAHTFTGVAAVASTIVPV